MNMYEALGSIAGAAHACGHRVERNVRPTDDGVSSHGLNIDLDRCFVQIRAAENEPRFDVRAPYPFSALLKDRYTPAEVSKRRGADFQELAEPERRAQIEALLRGDLAAIDEDQDEFQTKVKDEVNPVKPEILTLTYGEEDHWNGFLVEDYLFPDDDCVEITQYRRVLNRVGQTTSQLATLAHDTVETLSHNPDKPAKELEKHSMEGDESIAFQ